MRTFKTKTLNLDKMAIEAENLNKPQSPQLNIGAVMCRFSSQILIKMEKIIMQRGYGKTTQLIKKSAKSGDYIVCHRLDEARTELYKLDNQDEQLNFLCQNNNVYIYN